MQCQKMSRLNRRRMHTLLLCQLTPQWKDVCLLAAEITAWFQNIDDAEAAARELRRRGRGIRSLRIRQPRRVQIGGKGLLADLIRSDFSRFHIPSELSDGPVNLIPTSVIDSDLQMQS